MLLFMKRILKKFIIDPTKSNIHRHLITQKTHEQRQQEQTLITGFNSYQLPETYNIHRHFYMFIPHSDTTQRAGLWSKSIKMSVNVNARFDMNFITLITPVKVYLCMIRV